MYALRVKPLVADDFEFTVLLQTGVFVVNDVDQLLVVADDTEFTSRDVCLVEGDTVKGQFLDFARQRNFTPDKVFVAS